VKFSKVHAGKTLSDAFPVQNGIKQGNKCFIAIAFHPLEGPRKSGKIGSEWSTSSAGLCW
jgi:hypothetical protein